MSEADVRACPFCHVPEGEVLVGSEMALAFLDHFPISNGHTLIVPRSHIASFFYLRAEMQAAIWQLVAEVRPVLMERFGVESFNIGLNDGSAAGQTVPHAHVHLIPRYNGDVAEPRGGIRWVIPEKAAYWRGES